MKKALIKTDNYLLVVDDSEIKEGDCYLSPSGIWFYNHLNPNHVKECQKIIAHLPLNNSPILEGVPLLPPLEDEDDVEYIANKLTQHLTYPSERKEGIILGYNKAKEKYKFTEEDVKNALSESFKASQEGYQITTDEIIQSLSQSKTPTHFEFETLTVWVRNTDRNLPTKDDLDYEITSTTNSQGQQVVCGKYIY
jgi:hypothetical protein